GFFKGEIHAIAQTPDGYLWLATEFGLLRFDGVRAVLWQAPTGEHLPSNDIRGLAAARDGTLWLGTAKGLVSLKDGTLTHYPQFDGHDVNTLLEDAEGTLWASGTIWEAGLTIGNNTRLCSISRTGVQCYGMDGSFGVAGVTALYEDSRGNLWLGASNGPPNIQGVTPARDPRPFPAPISTDVSTVDTSSLPTVDTTSLSIVDKSAAVDMTQLPTVDRSSLSTAPRFATTWITEGGELVSQGRVKRISLAQDVINSTEEAVYDTLWSAKLVSDNGSSRVVQAGYDYLSKRTRLAKKTIQRIVAKLIEKDFIAIDRPADIYERTSTVYRVFSYKVVLEQHMKKGRHHVAKIGPGFVYVRQLHLSTVDTAHMSTVDSPAVYTVDSPTTATVDNENLSTVDRKSTNLGSNNLEHSSTALYGALKHYGVVDDEMIRRLIIECRSRAPDCTEDEIIHFVHEKGSLTRSKQSRIVNPIGFLLKTVPKCFEGESFRQFRQQQGREVSDQDHEQYLADLRAKLDDPAIPADEKELIRQILAQ
ncbi:MAG: hypothetical protein JO108_16305, partial [Acidobacteriaceae bacterium]|nr:hypothetical protein [Acidobacteriaceae bacterium]